MSSSFHHRMDEHLDSPEKKKVYNQQLFTEVAPRYDFVTRALSLGRDRAWKRRLVAMLPDRDPTACVDLACGTGDITRMMRARYPGSRVIGVDLTAPMLDIARQHVDRPPIDYRQADMCDTGLETASVDIVTGGYALRNAPDLDAALREVHRILTPGGTAAFLDFSKPSTRWLQHVELQLLSCWGGFWGWALHRNAEVYRYIGESLDRFPDRETLAGQVERHGFRMDYRKTFFCGIMELFLMTRDQ